MRGRDAELEALRAGVSCAVLLERLPPPWRLDRAESTRRCLKYSRGAGEVLIVNHEGRGWWDPLSRAKGDVFTLVQHLRPGLNLGQVRRLLRPLVGLGPAAPVAERRCRAGPPLPTARRWVRRPVVRPGSPAWWYLTGVRALPAAVVLAAVRTGGLREGPQASAWFAHRDHAGRLTGIEMRGPAWHGFGADGTKTLFHLPGRPPPLVPGGAARHRPPRLAVTEAPIEALSLAALEGLRADTLYLGAAGSMGPETITALEQLLAERAGVPEAVLVAATNADAAGECHAEHLAELAQAAGVRWARLLPPDSENDFNDALRALRREKGRGET